jgi:MinD-like ATPase involved in chromosome partitioning or flagellar assembly
MYTICWSVKGGSGTTVVASALAVVTARANEGAVLIDLAGDVPATLGIQEPVGPGVSEWLNTSTETPAEALTYLMTDAGDTLRVLHRGNDAIAESARTSELATFLENQSQLTVIDAGVGVPPQALREHALHSFLVIRPCYLALRRATAVAGYADGVILLNEAGRALTRRDVESVLQVPVMAEIPVDPAVARAVDAGLLASRLPTVMSSRLSAVA